MLQPPEVGGLVGRGWAVGGHWETCGMSTPSGTRILGGRKGQAKLRLAGAQF